MFKLRAQNDKLKRARAPCRETRERITRGTNQHSGDELLMRDNLFTKYFMVKVEISGIEPPEPDHKFVEIVKVGRDYHWSSDVTIYYKSETRSKLTFSLQLLAVDS